MLTCADAMRHRPAAGSAVSARLQRDGPTAADAPVPVRAVQQTAAPQATIIDSTRYRRPQPDCTQPTFMPTCPHVLWVIAAALWWSAPLAAAEVQTVCTITVNSADEKAAFQRHLPASKYRFVELVERARPDWLASACQAGVQCDVLIISGHYDGGREFFSDNLASDEFLPVDELERVACSESCGALFANLEEVHLFGCNTLNPQAQSSASAETVRSLLRDGFSLRDALRQQQALNAGHGQSSRDRMRLVFKDVPVIYGFSSVAPLGPLAAATLGGYFRSPGAHEIGQGRASPRLLAHRSEEHTSELQSPC